MIWVKSLSDIGNVAVVYNSVYIGVELGEDRCIPGAVDNEEELRYWCFSAK